MTVFRIGHDWDLSVVLLQDPRRIQAGTSGRLRLVLFGLLWFGLVQGCMLGARAVPDDFPTKISGREGKKTKKHNTTRTWTVDFDFHF